MRRSDAKKRTNRAARAAHGSSGVLRRLRKLFASRGPITKTRQPEPRLLQATDAGHHQTPSTVPPVRCAPCRTAAAVVTGLALVTPLAQAEEVGMRAYKCVKDGVTTLSNQPCGPNERRIYIDYDEPSPQDAAATDQRVREETAESTSFAQHLELKREIARAEGKISDLQKQRDAELATLRARLNQARYGSVEQSPIATGSVSSSAEQEIADVMANDNLVDQMKVINARYAEDVAVEQQRLQQLLKRQSALNEAPAAAP